MAANTIHMVETVGVSVALGMNFIHVDRLDIAAEHFERERRDDDDWNKCYPEFSMQAITYMAYLM